MPVYTDYPFQHTQAIYVTHWLEVNDNKDGFFQERKLSRDREVTENIEKNVSNKYNQVSG